MNLKLTVDEVNTILSALGNMPYSQVFQLVAKVHQQAAEQQGEAEAPSAAKADKK
ncbi:MAG: hypothetical protein AAFO69_02705 [Bacteroidota bacterium]